MILKKLTLRNYLQHRDMVVDFDGTLIAVVGRNGSGKSNLFGAIQFAFTGEQGGYNKDQLISWGESDGSVTLAFEHNGVEGEITRNLHNSGCTFTFGSDTYNSAAKAAEGIKVHLDLDKELAKQAVFVQQAAIDDILFTDPRVRELAFQKLMGIGSANKVYDALGKVIAEQAEPPNYDEQISQGKARWAEMHGRMQELEGKLSGLTLQRQQLPSATDYKAKIDIRRQALTLVQRYASVETIRQQYTLPYTQACNQLAQAAPVAELSLEKIDKEIAEAKALITTLINYNSTRSEWERCGYAVIELGKPPHQQDEIDALIAENNAVSATLNQMLGQWKLHNDMLTALTGGGDLKACPVCGSDITSTQQLSERLRDILKTLEEGGAGARTQTQALTTKLSQMTKALTDFNTRYRNAVAAYNTANERLLRFGNVGDSSDAKIQELQQQLVLAESVKANWLAAVTERRMLNEQITRAQKNIESAAAEQASILTAWTSLGVTGSITDTETAATTQQTILALEKERDTLMQLDTEIAQFTGAHTELKAAMESLDKTLAALEYKRASQQTYRDTIGTLGRVRDWFHYKNGPHTLSASVLATMTDEINGFLDQFAAPYTVLPAGDTLGFTVQFHDGRPQPTTPASASVLSGGEKIQLALSFRFAAYRMFSAKLGLLSLDEPTVYLDNRNVDRFGDLLLRVKQVAQGMNLMLLIATHERSVIPVCDTVIDLSKDDTLNVLDDDNV